MQGNNLSIIDADFLLYTATMGKKCLDDEGNPILLDKKFTYTTRTEQEIYDCADDILKNILNVTSADYYIGYLGNCKSFRYDIYNQYKVKRTGDKPNYFLELKYYLKDTWKFEYTENGLEADDAVNIVRNNFKNDFNCTIVTSDKDLIKSIEGNYLNVRNLELLNTSKEVANRFFWKSMITGDAVDGITGLKNRGEVFANKILDLTEELHTSYHMEVLNQYILHYKDELIGIEEFYKNYKLLKILDTDESFIIPELHTWKNKLQEGVEW